MSAATLDSPTPALSAGHMTGPKTPQGKAVAARNAVTHGLHTQDVVLPHLGESQAEYDALLDGLTRELFPRTAVEQHYVTQIAQAMWRLRRLTRWETSLYDDPALTDEERITKMARVLRHDSALRRHIDRALKALRDTPELPKRTRLRQLFLSRIGEGGEARQPSSYDELPKRTRPGPALPSSPAGGGEWACPLGGVSSSPRIGGRGAICPSARQRQRPP